MNATEFQTVINEPYVYIPQFEQFKGHKVRIILLDEELNSTQKRDDIDSFFDKFKLDLSDYRFDREEANER
ncbi:MAG: hypothetical protein ACOC08_03515 [Campylobacterales bacterium]